ncbi:MAG: filamentous hemagglutinin N-terminal domain-containing protein [Desulfobacteraceae bacterium]|nr:filamentous hemagglutinin N-terminal domain-containing protein [Desulfobacteraceae bacterium]
MKRFIINAQFIILFAFMFLYSASACAEAVFDGTMKPGTAGMTLTGDFEISAEHGRTAGTNLFHSFSTFNINTNETATFTGPDTIRNVISRVTGGSISQIDGGLLSEIPGANIYLLNPAGIMFGENAYLDITGSFHASTADYLAMENGEKFYTGLSHESVLSVSEPESFGFLDDSVGSISVTGGCELMAENTISLVGGNIDIIEESGLTAPGRINLASVASACEVTPTDSGFADLENAKRGRITISDRSFINTSWDGSGHVFILGGELFMMNESTIETMSEWKEQGGKTLIDVESLKMSNSSIMSGNYSYSDSPETENKGGDLIIRASESVELSDGSNIETKAEGEEADPNCHAGTIEIHTENVSLTGGSQIESGSLDAGKGGDVFIYAKENVEFLDSKIVSDTNSSKDAGNITIEAKNISFMNGSGPGSQTYGDGKGGKITLTASDTLTLSGTNEEGYASSITSYSYGEDSGNAGDVLINAKEISCEEGGLIKAGTEGTGKGGNITIIATGKIELNGVNPHGENEMGFSSGIASRSEGQEQEPGKAGNITIEAQTLSVTDQAIITNSTSGSGDAGDITLKADTLKLDTDASISSASESADQGGNAGTIDITAEDSVTLKNDSSVTTATSGKGEAGTIEIKAASLTLDTGSEISSESGAETRGGDAGTIGISVSDSVILSGNSFITTQAKDGGKGQVTINAGNQLYLENSGITTSILGGGEDAGNISAEQKILILNNGRIIAQAYEGRGGNIHIVANPMVQSYDSIVDASSKLGIDGAVRIDAPDEDITGSLILLPSDFTDASQWIKTPCAARAGEKISRFVIKGRDAVAFTFNDWLPSPLMWVEHPPYIFI